MFHINLGLQKLVDYLNSLISRIKADTKPQLEEEKLIIKSFNHNIYTVFHPLLPFSIFYYGQSYYGERIQNDIEPTMATIHIDEKVWLEKTNIIISRLNNRCGLTKKIHGRKTVLAKINKDLAMKFQEENHLHVALPGKYRYGLFNQGELVSMALFSKGRKMKTKGEDYTSYELLRFCHKKEFQVSGALTKFLKHFEQEKHPHDIMTYIDLDWQHGNSYEYAGFELISKTDPICIMENLETGEKKFNSGSLKLVKSFIKE